MYNFKSTNTCILNYSRILSYVVSSTFLLAYFFYLIYVDEVSVPLSSVRQIRDKIFMAHAKKKYIEEDFFSLHSYKDYVVTRGVDINKRTATTRSCSLL